MPYPLQYERRMCLLWSSDCYYKLTIGICQEENITFLISAVESSLISYILPKEVPMDFCKILNLILQAA